YKIDVAAVADLWNHGSVVRSWLLELAARALASDPTLGSLDAYVDDSGEGRWTLDEAINRAVPMPVLTAALFTRFRSREANPFAERLLAALRNQFGGHAVKKHDAWRIALRTARSRRDDADRGRAGHDRDFRRRRRPRAPQVIAGPLQLERRRPPAAADGHCRGRPKSDDRRRVPRVCERRHVAVLAAAPGRTDVADVCGVALLRERDDRRRARAGAAGG